MFYCSHYDLAADAADVMLENMASMRLLIVGSVMVGVPPAEMTESADCSADETAAVTVALESWAAIELDIC